MKKTLLSIVLFASLSTSVFAQITVEESYITGMVGQTIDFTSFSAMTMTGLDAVVAADGENQTWDFTGATYDAGFTFAQTITALPADVPDGGIAEFASADYVRAILSDTLTGFFFENLDGGVLSSPGFLLISDADDDGMADTLATQFSPPSIDIVFPATYQSTWRDSTTTTITAEGFTITSYVVTETEIDGWGTLITPAGSGPALRVKDTSRSGIIGLPIGETTSISYDFVTLSGMTAFVEVDDDGNVVVAEYSVQGDMMPTAIEPDGSGVPESFVLDQNYPNPFNPSTHISFSLPEASYVNLTVYTLTGEAVATLVNGNQQAGSYNVTFDGADLASGVYLYRLQTERFSQSRVMSLVK